MGKPIGIISISSCWVLFDHCCISIHTQDRSHNVTYSVPIFNESIFQFIISQLMMNHAKSIMRSYYLDSKYGPINGGQVCEYRIFTFEVPNNHH